MSDTDDTNRALTALRERQAGLMKDLEGHDWHRGVIMARLSEIEAAIDIVERNGRKKPGPKAGGTRLATAELASVAADAESEP